MKAYSYLRFSHKKQSAGRSENRQSQTADAYCQRKGWTLDATLYADRGVSGFKGRNAATGRLGAFLKAIESGKVEPGDVLIVESLDRLSRQDIDDAYDLFRGILKTGVEIITLNPERHYDKTALKSITGIIEPLVIMARANEESAMKSGRGKDAWKARRAKAQETNTPATATCPKWLTPVKEGGKAVRFVVIPERVEIVRRIFNLALNGVGRHSIARTLNNEGVESWNGGKGWNLLYIQRLLTGRTVLGEFQPQRRTENGREKVGNPVPDYYPAVVEAKDYWRVQAILNSRKGKERGRRWGNVPNLFSGLLFDAWGGTPMTLKSNGRKTGEQQLVSSGAMRGMPGSPYCGFPYRTFEESALLYLNKYLTLDTADKTKKTAEREAVEAELNAAQARLERTKADYATADDPDVRAAILDALATVTSQVKRLTEQVEKAKADETTDPQADLKATQSVISAYYTALEMSGWDAETGKRNKPINADETERLRESIRSKIKSLVKEAWVKVEAKSNNDRTAIVEFHFVGGVVKTLRIRTYRTPAEWEVENTPVATQDLKHLRLGAGQ
jgi:DNA invertase Pin-like site-specific DNA recombinase